MKKNYAFLFVVIFIILSPLVNSREECEDINEILKQRWPWSLEGGDYFKVHQFPLSTRLIYEYKDNKEYLTYGFNPPTQQYHGGTYLKVDKRKWKKDTEIWLPEATPEIGLLLYKYNGAKDAAADIKWTKYKIKCTRKKPTQKYDYVFAKSGDNLWRIWHYSRSISDDYNLPFKQFLEVNQHIPGVKDYLAKIKNKEDPSNVKIKLKKGDKVYIGSAKLMEKAKEDALPEDRILQSRIKNFGKDNNAFFLDTKGLFDYNPTPELRTLRNTQNVFVKIFTISAVEMGSYSISEITDEVYDETSDSFLSIREKSNYNLVVMVIMEQELSSGDDSKKVISIGYNFNLDPRLTNNLIKDSFLKAAEDESLQSSIEKVIQSKDNLMNFFSFLIDGVKSIQEKYIADDLLKFGLKQSAKQRLQKIRSGNLPDDSFYERSSQCVIGLNILMDYVFGIGTSCDLGISNKDAWKHQGEVIKQQNEKQLGWDIIRGREINLEDLRPGSIIGMRYSKTTWQHVADMPGHSGYTHLGFYLGGGEMAHKFLIKLRTDPVEKILKSMKKLREDDEGELKVIEALVPPLEILNKERPYATKEFVVSEGVLEVLSDLNIPPQYNPVFLAEIAELNDIKDIRNNLKKRDKIEVPISDVCGFEMENQD